MRKCDATICSARLIYAHAHVEFFVRARAGDGTEAEAGYHRIVRARVARGGRRSALPVGFRL